MPRIHFHQQLMELKEGLMGMAALAQAVESAVEAYQQQDLGLCKFVRQTEAAIDTAQRDVDEMAFDLLAKEQPMAIDLRFILAVIKINVDLERIGDQASGIAKRTQKTVKAGGGELPVDFGAMGESVCRMIRSALRSLLEGDARLAESVREMDDEVDRLNRLAFEDLLRLIEQKPEMTQQAMNGILVAKNLERIADHAANIATDVIFWIRGADVRHQLAMAMD